MPQAILIVMQDVLFSQTLRHKLSHFGVKVFITETAGQALELLDMRKMDVVLLDVRGNNLPAVQFLKDLKKSAIEVDTILISSIDDVSISIECMGEGASDEITVPFDIESLKAKIDEAVKRSKLRQKQRKAGLSPLDTFQQAMVTATFAQEGDFDSARAIIGRIKDSRKTGNKDQG
jgi:two-component system response regulator HydG